MAHKTSSEITLDDLAGMIQRGFLEQQTKIHKLDSRMDKLESNMDKRFEQVDKRLDHIDSTLQDHGQRLGRIETKLDTTTKRVNHHTIVIDELRAKVA